MKYLGLILVSVFCQFTLSSQVLETKNWCLSQCDIVGDERENTELVYLQFKNDSISHSHKSPTIKRVPLRIGIIQVDTVDVELKELLVRRAIDDLNASFAPAKFVFYIDRTDVIKSDLKIEDLSQDLYAPYNEFSDNYDLDDVMSIYIFDHKEDFCKITPTSISCGRTGGFSYVLSNRTNNFVMSRFDLSDPKVFAHEMGHFFGLYHTFEEVQYGKDTFDSQLCDQRGDRLCDTPPDPGTIFEVYVNYSLCELQGLTDENGNSYKPLINNYMSYYKPCYLKEYSFTNDQISMMKMAASQPIRSKFTR